jgi:RNA polymerase sigma factor (sigma-70 family)
MSRTAIGWRPRRWNGERPTGALPDNAAPGHALADRDTGAIVRQALMALPADQRAVVVLRYYEGCSEAEIAAVLGYAPGTVKSRASRALASLRQSGLLAEEGLIG